MQIEHVKFPGLLNGHIQTVLGSFGRRHVIHHPSFHHRITFPDGDQVSCVESRPAFWNQHHPTTIMVHGLGGDEDSRYMLRMAKLLLEDNHRVIRTSMRSCGPRFKECICSRPYHGGLSDDILNVVKHFQIPSSPMIALGFSLGGNILLKLAGEQGHNMSNYLKGIVAVCPPFDLHATVKKILSTKTGFYKTYFILRLRSQYKQWAANNPHLNPPKLPLMMNIKEFDDFHTAPRWGFKHAEDYYEQSSCKEFIPHIKNTRVKIITANDDPVVNNKTLNSIHLPPDVKVLNCSGGGHMGFLTPLHRNGLRWIERVLLDIIKEKVQA